MHFSSFAVNRAVRSVCVCAVSRSSAFQLSLQLSYDFSCLTRRVYSPCLLRVFVVDSSNLNVQRFGKATPNSPALSARSCREFTLFCCSCGAAFLASWLTWQLVSCHATLVELKHEMLKGSTGVTTTRQCPKNKTRNGGDCAEDWWEESEKGWEHWKLWLKGSKWDPIAYISYITCIICQNIWINTLDYIVEWNMTLKYWEYC